MIDERLWVGVVDLLAATEGADLQELLCLGFIGVQELDGGEGNDLYVGTADGVNLSIVRRVAGADAG